MPVVKRKDKKPRKGKKDEESPAIAAPVELTPEAKKQILAEMRATARLCAINEVEVEKLDAERKRMIECLQANSDILVNLCGRYAALTDSPKPMNVCVTNLATPVLVQVYYDAKSDDDSTIEYDESIPDREYEGKVVTSPLV